MKAITVGLMGLVLCVNTVLGQDFTELSKKQSTTVHLQNFAPNQYIGNLESSSGIGDWGHVDSVLLRTYPHLKNLPDSISNRKIQTYILNYNQYYYQNYSAGKINLLEYTKNIPTRDSAICTRQMTRCFFSYVTGINKSNQPCYIIDKNGNDDFADDTLYQIGIAPAAHQVTVEAFDGTQIKKRLVTLSVVYYNREPASYFAIKFTGFRYGRIKVDDHLYYVCSNDMFNDKVYLIPARPYYSNYSNDFYIEQNQVIRLGNGYYSFAFTSQHNDVVRFDPHNTSDKNLKSKQAGMLAPDVSGINCLTGKPLSLASLRGKYVFLDFWSVTCSPCIADLPNLQKVYQQYHGDQFECLSVCDSRGHPNFFKFLKDKAVIMPTIDSRNQHSDTSKYNITSFPTTYLIDPNGVIITTKLDALELRQILENLKIKPHPDTP